MAVGTASVVTPAPPTAGRKVTISASRGVRARRRLGDARAGAHQLDRRHRLHQKIGDTHLHEAARHRAVETLGDGDHRRPTADPQHETFERLQFGLVGGVDVGNDDGRAADVEIGRRVGEPALDESRPICALAENVARTDSSNAASAVRTTTLAWIAGVVDRLIRIA